MKMSSEAEKEQEKIKQQPIKSELPSDEIVVRLNAIIGLLRQIDSDIVSLGNALVAKEGEEKRKEEGKEEEPKITEKQLELLKRLMKSEGEEPNEGELRQLSAWKASALIEAYIKRKKEKKKGGA
jgi:hypothetical protein